MPVQWCTRDARKAQGRCTGGARVVHGCVLAWLAMDCMATLKVVLVHKGHCCQASQQQIPGIIINPNAVACSKRSSCTDKHRQTQTDKHRRR